MDNILDSIVIKDSVDYNSHNERVFWLICNVGVERFSITVKSLFISSIRGRLLNVVYRLSDPDDAIVFRLKFGI